MSSYSSWYHTALPIGFSPTTSPLSFTLGWPDFIKLQTLVGCPDKLASNSNSRNYWTKTLLEFGNTCITFTFHYRQVYYNTSDTSLKGRNYVFPQCTLHNFKGKQRVSSCWARDSICSVEKNGVTSSCFVLHYKACILAPSVKQLKYAYLMLTLRRLMSYIYGAPILDVSRSHTTTQHSR